MGNQGRKLRGDLRQKQIVEVSFFRYCQWERHSLLRRVYAIRQIGSPRDTEKGVAQKSKRRPISLASNHAIVLQASREVPQLGRKDSRGTGEPPEQPLPSPNMLGSCALPHQESIGQREGSRNVAANMLMILCEPLKRFGYALPREIFPDRHRALPVAAATMQVRKFEQPGNAER
jgi:hypothetical protein